MNYWKPQNPKTKPSAERDSFQSLGEALSWAREHAVSVHVRLAGGDTPADYSAGEIPLEFPELPPGFEVTPRRAGDWRFIDRGLNEDPIQWDVLLNADHDPLTIHGWYDASTVAPTEWWIALGTSRECETIELAETLPPLGKGLDENGTVTGWTYSASPIAVVRVTGRTRDEATETASTIATKAARAAGWDTASFWAEDAYPTGSKPALWNAHL
jgi:hypothetical protein